MILFCSPLNRYRIYQLPSLSTDLSNENLSGPLFCISCPPTPHIPTFVCGSSLLPSFRVFVPRRIPRPLSLSQSFASPNSSRGTPHQPLLRANKGVGGIGLSTHKSGPPIDTLCVHFAWTYRSPQNIRAQRPPALHERKVEGGHGTSTFVSFKQGAMRQVLMHECLYSFNSGFFCDHSS